MTNALQYGNAVFGGIRGYYHAEQKAMYAFRVDDHYKRLLSASRIIGCGLPYSAEKLKDITVELIKKNKPTTDAYLRMFAYAGHTELGPNLANTTLDFSLYMIPLGEYLPVSKGLNVMVSSWQRISDNAIPTRAKISGGYINSSLARKEAYDNGYDEAIMLHKNGTVSEGSAENIFIVRDGVLITPSVSEGILEGITRKSVIKIAQDMGMTIETRPVERSELYVADEVFLSGTACQVAWVHSIDKRVISEKIGPITKQLQEKFFNVVHRKDNEYNDWFTKVQV